MPESSASWILITSPGLRTAPALIPVAKVTTSLSNLSVNKCHLPYLCACPCDVQPNAVTVFLVILPDFCISSMSSTTSVACL